MRTVRWTVSRALLVIMLAAVGCTSRIEGLSNEQVGQVYAQVRGITPPRTTNVGLYFAYPVYGFLMDVLSSPFDLCTYLLDDLGRDFGKEVDRIVEEKKSSKGTLSLGYGAIVTLYGAAAITRAAVVLVDNVLLRNGAGDYYSLNLGSVPKNYFFPHRNNWPFEQYDSAVLWNWATTEEGKRAIQAWKAAHRQSGGAEGAPSSRAPAAQGGTPAGPSSTPGPGTPVSQGKYMRDATFNLLTHVLVDRARGKVEFFGNADPDGPSEGVPYEQFLAAALQLPEERGAPGALGSVPGFSLEPIGELGPIYAQAQSLSANQDELKRRMTEFVGKMDEAQTRAYTEIVGRLVYRDFRQWVSKFLYSRMDRQQVDAGLSSAANMLELADFLKGLRTKGTLSDGDVAAFEQALNSLGTACTQKKGTYLLMPPGSFEAVYGVTLFSKPTFFGIEPDTQLARVVHESDCVLKSLVAGPSCETLKEDCPYHEGVLEWHLKRTGASMGQEPLVIQLVPGKIELDVSPDGSVISISKAEMTIPFRSRKPGGEIPEAARAYGEFLTNHFDDYASVTASLWEARELFKVVAVARHLKKQGFVPQVPIDRSWRAPERVKAQWDLGSLGVGEGAQPVAGAIFAGGVDLQMEARIQTRQVPPERAQAMRDAVAEKRQEQQRVQAASTLQNVSPLAVMNLAAKYDMTPEAVSRILQMERLDVAGFDLREEKARTLIKKMRAVIAVEDRERALRTRDDSIEEARAALDRLKDVEMLTASRDIGRGLLVRGGARGEPLTPGPQASPPQQNQDPTISDIVDKIKALPGKFTRGLAQNDLSDYRTSLDQVKEQCGDWLEHRDPKKWLAAKARRVRETFADWEGRFRRMERDSPRPGEDPREALKRARDNMRLERERLTQEKDNARREWEATWRR